ncbi:UDP-N-acetyl-D-glucosamine dehydrogenase [Streptomyces sp. 840.1]|uniref:nucleotide sugar dehydrogenase n=1 Tax=Streptomyces sp. 840.1 TaxID=2485152 RepID=UPI000F4AC040|nr:nucleotide sugar dehydrogenase [Streptomyces sp. 840.1]ROQ68145.1 UDP-N-acetyl-D-glucosamine dehydrogenase [Streptomyces sp. 840.1]
MAAMTGVIAPAIHGRDGAQVFDEKIGSRTLRVGIVGLGYTGLPLGLGFATAGLPVRGLDTDAERVDRVARGSSYLPDVSDAELASVSRKLSATTEPGELAGSDVLIVCVPTPVTGDQQANLDYVNSAMDSVAPLLRRGTLLILQSTVPPGTTAAAAAALADATGLEPGTDFHMAMAPERVDPANTGGWNLANTPKVVGGLTEECTRRAAALFGLVCETVVPVSRTEVAELSKVFENTFRLVNISLTLELSDLCRQLEIPVREVIDAASTKPYGFLPHYPGPGVGGECIPVDPLFLREAADRLGTDMKLVAAAFERVEQRPGQVVDRLAELIGARGSALSGAKVLVVGVSYKSGVADLRNAPALDVIRGLRSAGATVSYHDPLVPDLVVDGQPVAAAEWAVTELAQLDAAVLVTAVPGLEQDLLWGIPPIVLDTHNKLEAASNVAVL